MPLLPDSRTVLISALCGAILGGVLAWCVQGWRLGAEIATLKSASASLQATLNHNAADYAENVRKADSDSAATIGVLSDQLHEALSKNVQIEHERDTAIAAGTQRVYVRASCPAAGNLSADSSAASGAHAIAAELDPAYRQSLSDLRLGAKNGAAQIVGLQAYARECYRLNQPMRTPQ